MATPAAPVRAAIAAIAPRPDGPPPAAGTPRALVFCAARAGDPGPTSAAAARAAVPDLDAATPCRVIDLGVESPPLAPYAGIDVIVARVDAAAEIPDEPAVSEERSAMHAGLPHAGALSGAALRLARRESMSAVAIGVAAARRAVAEGASPLEVSGGAAAPGPLAAAVARLAAALAHPGVADAWARLLDAPDREIAALAGAILGAASRGTAVRPRGPAARAAVSLAALAAPAAAAYVLP
ncbi:MAG TPA: hypothetical protein VG389_13845 [Myxococcota bacterium]|nr:hypothetical protein [Myxococcota bacterium]